MQPQTAAHQAPPSLGFSRQEHWSGLPYVKVKLLSCVWLSATPWTAAYQAPPSMGFSGKSTGVGCHCLLWLKEQLCPKTFHCRTEGKNPPYFEQHFIQWYWTNRSSLEGAILILEFSVSIFWSETLVAQSGPTLCKPMDCSLPGSSVLGIFQTRVLEWVAISFSRGSSWPRDWTRVSHIVGTLLSKPPGKHILQSDKFIGYLRGGKGLKPNKFWILST